MYKVFYNQKPILLTTECNEVSDDYPLFFAKYTTVESLLKALKSKRVSGLYFYHPNREKLEKHFLKFFPKVEAAGGFVAHQDGRFLFIYRNDKWDLPKGRVEGKETIPVAAIREVEEETGVADLILQKPLMETFHLFRRNGKYKLKRTHWYQMTTTYNGLLAPQVEEGIKRAVWVPKDEVSRLLENAYANIALIFEEALA